MQAQVRSVDPAITRLAAALIAVVLLAWSGSRISRIASVKATQLNRAKSTLATFASLRQKYEPAVAAESIAWRRTWMELQDLGIIGDERLAITQSVARAAEAAGLRDVKVLIGPPDTTGSEARLSTEGVRRKAAPFSLLVESRGGLRSVVAFLGHLPPSVAATQLSLVRQDGHRSHKISLAVYELIFSNGPPSPSLWSSVERGDPRDSGGRRPGG
jgi:site-specific recombinase XerC